MNESIQLGTYAFGVILLMIIIFLSMASIAKHSIEKDGYIRRAIYKYIYRLKDFQLITDIELENKIGNIDRWRIMDHYNDRFHLVKIKNTTFIFNYYHNAAFPTSMLIESQTSCPKSISIGDKFYIEEYVSMPWNVSKVIKILENRVNQKS